MKRKIVLFFLMLFTMALAGQPKSAAGIPCQMEELTSPQFVKATELSGGVCVIPLGIIEKH
ncbi:MAG TPA: hypothetical protein VLQ76_07230, partial [Bacteroidales bacterium]|nr:hypothetical protein [Bacteroidales bacterium]